MASYFIERGLPVPRELDTNPLIHWRRWLAVFATIAVLAVSLQLTDIDVSRANPDYFMQVLTQLLQPDWSILGPQNEFETWRDGALGLMIQTIFLGIIATAIAVVFALPLSFLGARNIMAGNPITAGVYTFVRLLFTVLRSIDVLIVVILALTLFGLGSASGVFAIALHTIGVIGKLYSEAIEGIESGPVEAITATGANRFQVIWTAVIPQIVNPFISFTIYRLDTSVRLAPVIGLVGGGGIGVMLFQNIQLLRYHASGTIILLIIVTVAAMDFISAQVRRRLV
ncbi:MAG: phosphonate ABC transporter, permease protein PhnE [Chloroflexi bacterium 13_1_40CM_4_68_4]|nr:MAG: phosphonate ABC transporter, permease protein PhnE [Chloroflexi bacterium 13_1_40CM_4_68_4]